MAGMHSDRVEAFSDGVMAVIITLMAFSVKPPYGAELSDLGRQVPALLAYVLSFTFIGIYYNNHHHLLRATHRISAGVMWANLHLLFWLSLVPVVTAWVANFYNSALPAAAYGVVDLGAAIAYSLLVRAIIRANGDDSVVARAIGNDVKGRLSLGMYAAAIGVAFVSSWLAYALFVAVALMWLIPDRRIAREVTADEVAAVAVGPEEGAS